MIDEFAQAERLLQQVPVPADIIKRLNALRKTVPKDMRELFDDYYEAAEILR